MFSCPAVALLALIGWRRPVYDEAVMPTPPPVADVPGRDGPAQRLVVAYAFAPYADTSAVAATKRVAVDGVAVDVLSNAMDRIRGRDPSLDELVAGLVRRHETLPTPSRFGGWGSVRAFTDAGRATLRRWAQEPGGTPYTSVFSRAHFIASHVLAATVVAGRPELRWSAEISDPLSRTATGQRRDGAVPDGPLAAELAEILDGRGVRIAQEATVFEWAETLAYVLADEVVFTSDGQRDHCLDLVRDPVVRRCLERSARVRPHPTLPQEWYSRRPGPVRLDPGVRHVGYFGRFYASQDPRGLFAAVAMMEPADRARVQVHLFTGPTPILSEDIAAFGVGDTVLLHDRLPFLDFLAATRQMDLLLAVDAAPTGGSAPHVRLSKWSDYVGAGVDVWGIVAEGSDLAGVRLAHRTPLAHPTAMLQTLTTVARGG